MTLRTRLRSKRMRSPNCVLILIEKDLSRKELYCFRKFCTKIYVISGRHGSGKTKVVGVIVKELLKQGEDATKLVAVGYDYVSTMGDKQIYRKRK
jgi:Ni2+-binding GTPase involved in maturation of urease and hydrogenase